MIMVGAVLLMDLHVFVTLLPGKKFYGLNEHLFVGIFFFLDIQIIFDF